MAPESSTGAAEQSQGPAADEGSSSATSRIAGGTLFDHREVFTHMLRRKALRQTRGRFHKTRPIFTLISFVLLTVLTLVAYAEVEKVTTPDGETVSVVVLSWTGRIVRDPEASIAVAVLTAVIYLAFLLFSLKLIVRFDLVFGQYLVVLAIIVQAGFVIAKFVQGDPGAEEPSPWVFLAFLYVMAAYLLFNLLYKKLYPVCAVHPAFMPRPADLQVTNLEPLEGATPRARVAAKFRYRPAPWKRLQEASFTGEVDEDGNPDGFGCWKDTDEHGETLQGTWSAGDPTGPFCARETKSSSGFVKIRVGFYSCRSEDTKPPQTVSFNPKHCGYAKTTVGVITTECCVSGAFFRDFPQMAMQWEQAVFPQRLAKQARTASDDVEAQGEEDCATSFSSAFRKLCNDVSCVDCAEALSEDGDHSKLVLVMADPVRGLSIPRFEREAPSEEHEDGTDGEEDATVRLRVPLVHRAAGGPRLRYEPRVEVEGWTRSGPGMGCTDAVVYIHGYNSSCDNGCRLIGQLWTFASFPAHVRPFVFSWPTGTLMAFPLSRRASETPEVAKSLRDMVVGIAATGVKRFHFMGHSMGIRPFCEALGMLEEVFHSNLEKENSGEEISVEIDGCSSPVVLPGKLEMSTVTFLNPEYGARKFVSQYLKRIQAMCEVLTIYGDVNDLALKSAYWFINIDSWITDQGPPWGDARALLCGLKEHDIPLGKDLMAEELQEPPVDSSFAPLDLVDCTHLDVNVQDSRHNGFSLNRSLVEDIYEAITYRVAASARRSRLEHLKGNVYEFKVAPKFVDGSNT